MSKTSHPGRGHPGPEWRVSHRASRTDWSDTVERCGACRARVDMSEAHYQLLLERDIDKPGKITLERERVVFCDESCAAEWESTA
ncbi:MULTISPECIES: hypothetical protein [unclassified Haloferax]|uniref:hypothetical protein n=1 Tax=Haloferax TaxID=2251 RepID=UPI0002AF9570|nr:MULTISPECIES: hypothetical protein [unclassified Haloferax]ELZ60729.1 hypothetical protein C460_02924 [Haloferax sp. ATCC BAA-646]ELZ65508.1 hypothetical protein C459_05921 [Haloferax sp. ATCC BAA-645]ELZ69022.1 hypothetical protein C458_07581 [Haloferax sp. ATCC BAA-644]